MIDASNIYEVSFRGVKAKFLVSNPNDLIQACFRRGYYFDIGELEDLIGYLRWDSKIIDIGANVGNHTIFFAKHFPCGQVIPFEVNPPACSLLRSNVAINELANVDVSHVGIGLGDAPGQISMVHSRGDNLGGTAFKPGGDGAGDLIFSCNSIDNLLPEIECVDFIKIDVEGMEFSVLDGATSLIARNRPLIFLENFGWVSGLRLLSWMASYNYYIEKIYGPNYLLAPMPRGIRYEASCVADVCRITSDAISSGSDSFARESMASLFAIVKSEYNLLHALAEAFLKIESVDCAKKCLDAIESGSFFGRLGIIQSKCIVAERSNDLERVGELLVEIFKEATQDANVAARLCDYFWSKKKGWEAYAVISKFVVKNPNSSLGHHTMSVMAERMGRYDQAIEHADLATRDSGPDTPSLMVRLADLMRTHDGNLYKAYAIIEKAISLGQNSSWAESVHGLIREELASSARSESAEGDAGAVSSSRTEKIPMVGIVIVSYNASTAVRITLASLRRAYNETAFKVILVDNASELPEREKIRASMSRHISEVGPSWRYLEQDNNLGFSGGNNIGISEFLADEGVSHICLLNSDVIVTDHWLDRLLVTKSDIVSAVTNKADSEQCVPIDYQAELAECFDYVSETIQEKIYNLVSDFSGRRHRAWEGNLIETDVTFFCVLLSVRACRDIGLLDETFFPGGFEDDDYCLRARKAGYHIHLARDVYIHHWGSASFGQLQYEYFSARAQKNKEYLEKKHGIAWQRRPEKPIISLMMDVDFFLQHKGHLSSQKKLIELYFGSLAKQIAYFESEFRNLRSVLSSIVCAVPEPLKRQVESAEMFGDLNCLWDSVMGRIENLLASRSAGDSIGDSVTADLKRIAMGIHEKVECNFAIHAFITALDRSTASKALDMPLPVATAPISEHPSRTRVRKFFGILRRGVDFFMRFDGIVFFGGYFYAERQSDGYFQRIQVVDHLFSDRWRVYVESDELRGRDIWIDRPESQVLVLRITGKRTRRMLVRLLAMLAVLRSRKIYFHSVLRMYDNRFGWLLHLPLIRKAVDIHGVVPEEFRMHNDFYSAVLYEKEERLAVKKAGIVIVVTDAMKQYLQQKFRDGLKAKIVSFPIFPNFIPTHASRPLVDGKPIVVYAGGLHKWQQVPKMIDAIIKTVDRCSHRFYCPEPQLVKDMLPLSVAELVTVEAKSHTELMALYPECHFGFILREDIIVNRAACPTKLVEYLAMGIVPIVDSEDIGDFKSLGMHSVHLDDFIAGRLPNEEQRVEMAGLNLAVYECLKEARETGAADIQTFFCTKQ